MLEIASLPSTKRLATLGPDSDLKNGQACSYCTIKKFLSTCLSARAALDRASVAEHGRREAGKNRRLR